VPGFSGNPYQLELEVGFGGCAARNSSAGSLLAGQPIPASSSIRCRAELTIHATVKTGPGAKWLDDPEKPEQRLVQKREQINLPLADQNVLPDVNR
jgi:hypothetical protein